LAHRSHGLRNALERLHLPVIHHQVDGEPNHLLFHSAALSGAVLNGTLQRYHRQPGLEWEISVK
jgi:hypothetical protein